MANKEKKPFDPARFCLALTNDGRLSPMAKILAFQLQFKYKEHGVTTCDVLDLAKFNGISYDDCKAELDVLEDYKYIEILDAKAFTYTYDMGRYPLWFEPEEDNKNVSNLSVWKSNRDYQRYLESLPIEEKNAGRK